MYGLTKLETGVTPPRLANLISYSWRCHEMPGAFAEFGVCQGGSLDLLAQLHPKRKIYGIDSFEGLPAPGVHDTHAEGDFRLSDAEFNKIVKHFKNKSVTICKGFSPEVFTPIAKEMFSFVHVDVDMYESVSHALDFFFPRLYHGGIMIFDDYGFPTTPGAKKAIDEFNQPVYHRSELRMADGTFLGQYIIIK
jgi:hypothetical protein